MPPRPDAADTATDDVTETETDTVTDTDTDSPPETDTTDETDTDAPPDTDTDTIADTDLPPGPTLDGVLFSDELQAALADCVPLVADGRRARAMAIAIADIDGDGHVEALLANQVCPNADGVDVISPWVRYDPALGTLVVGEPLSDRLVGGTITRSLSTVTLLDVDRDGDADLVGGIVNGDEADAVAPLWWNDGTGQFTPAPYRTAGPAFSFADGGPLGVVDLENDGRMDLVFPVWKADRSDHILAVLRTATTDDLVLEVGRFDDVPGIFGWSLVPYALQPTVRPWALLFATGVLPGVTHDYSWYLPGGRRVPDTFIEPTRDSLTGAVVDGALFLEPVCGSSSPGCFTPMGASMVRFPTDTPTGRVVQDCLLVSTLSSRWPVSVLCPRAAGDGFEESGPLSRALAAPPSPVTHIAWLPSAQWDVNADGWMDVLVTFGRDAGPFPKMNQRAYLQRPDCYDTTCGRFTVVDLPMPAAHHYASFLQPVQDPSGAWSVLVWWSSHAEAEAADAQAQVVRWQAAEGTRWLALQVGPRTDLSVAGAVARPVFYDAADAVLPGTEEILISVASTVGAPGTNNPLILGVPEGAVRARIEVTFVGCRGTATVEGNTLEGVWTVEVPACP